MTDTAKAEPRTLYVRRNVVNASEIIDWAKAQGFQKTVPASEMHVTITFSRALVDWVKMGEAYSEKIEVGAGGPRVVEPLGDKGAVVLQFASSELAWRHHEMMENGASWDFDDYWPHVTITYDGTDIDLSKVEPFRGKIVLGHEIFEEVNEDWKDTVTEKFQTVLQISKVSPEKRIVSGWANVYEENGQAVIDAHGDVIEEAELEKAAYRFMEDARSGKAMHSGPRVGTVVESMVFTREKQAQLGIDLGKAGWWISMKIHDEEVWEKVKDGTYGAFSFGGRARREEMESADEAA